MNIKYIIGKNLSKIVEKAFYILPSGGKSFPGLFFIRLAGEDQITSLKNDQIEKGSILITGTNGKTTTTTMFIDLISKDMKISKSVGNNTIYSLTTGILANKGKIGVFEYGIRDIEHGRPADIERLLKPIGVVYTNISREHTQVLGKKNSLEDYIKAKTLLSQNMSEGMIITNCDDPITYNIGLNKKDEVKIVTYGLETDNIEDIHQIQNVSCPQCNKTLEYTKNYLNHRGLYSCECGFKRPTPDMRLTRLETDSDMWHITIEGSVYNYILQQDVDVNCNLNIPVLGIHNLYNILCSTTAYCCYTDKIENINEKIEDYFNSIDFSILPPGRFELFNVYDKLVGIGQGDNGDALKVNTLLIRLYAKDEDVEMIYTTPDEYEEEIFEDHKSSIHSLNPKHLIVTPGRISVKKAEEYYDEIKDEYDSAFYPLKFDFEERVNKMISLVKESEYKYIIISGCGEEQVFWDEIKRRLKNN